MTLLLKNVHSCEYTRGGSQSQLNVAIIHPRKLTRRAEEVKGMGLGSLKQPRSEATTPSVARTGSGAAQAGESFLVFSLVVPCSAHAGFRNENLL